MSTIRADNYSDRLGTVSTSAEYVVKGPAKAGGMCRQTGTQTIENEFNVSSITDNSLGTTEFSFTNNFATTRELYVISGAIVTGRTGFWHSGAATSSIAGNSFRFDTNAYADNPSLVMTTIGTLA